MRILLKLLVVLGVIVACVWIGGEMWLARKATALIAAQSRLEAAAVRTLRDPQRVGIRIARLDVTAPEGSFALPWLDLWVPPQRPNEVHATLPPTATGVVNSHPVTIAAEGAGFSARFAPAHGLALAFAQAGGLNVTLDGQPLAGRAEVTARLAGFGSDAPRNAGAAYDVAADITGLSLATLTGGAATEPASVTGTGRIWLDHAPGQGGRDGTPRLVGLRADGLELRLGDLGARIRGRVEADAEGRAEGLVMIDTTDAEELVARAAELGLLPQATANLAAGLLCSLADGTAAAAQGDAATMPLRQGEVRIPIGFRNGRTWLGPLPLGSAPRFPI